MAVAAAFTVSTLLGTLLMPIPYSERFKLFTVTLTPAIQNTIFFPVNPRRNSTTRHSPGSWKRADRCRNKRLLINDPKYFANYNVTPPLSSN
nr:hypothetical protein Iba_scaffold49869CG0020 [Ipomoea batatas]